MKLSDYKPLLESEAKYKDLAQQSTIEGYIIIFDLTGSSSLKHSKPFPNWIEDYVPFYNIITAAFDEYEVGWYKFLGDAFLFFIPSTDNPNYPGILKHISANDVITVSRKVMDSYWDKYKIYKDKTVKGDRKHVNFREITCAIDYGQDIINWFQLLSDNKDIFDPIGKTVDRCFRLSAYAGAGHLVTSGSFYNQLVDTVNTEAGNFYKIHIKEGSLKGFDRETIVYYDKPVEDKALYYIDEKNVSLVEDSKEMDVKVKIRLMREYIKTLEQGR